MYAEINIAKMAELGCHLRNILISSVLDNGISRKFEFVKGFIKLFFFISNVLK